MGGLYPGGDRQAQRQGEAGQGQNGDMHQHLPAQRGDPLQQVRVGVAGQQRDLEERQAGVPHRWRAAKPGQHQLGDHRLDQEHQGRAEEGGRHVQGPGRTGGGGHRAPLRRITFDCRKGRACAVPRDV